MRVFPAPPAQHFVDTCNSALVLELQRRAPELQAMRVRDRVVTGVRVRLEMVAPYISACMTVLDHQSPVPRHVAAGAEPASPSQGGAHEPQAAGHCGG